MKKNNKVFLFGICIVFYFIFIMAVSSTTYLFKRIKKPGSYLREEVQVIERSESGATVHFLSTDPTTNTYEPVRDPIFIPKEPDLEQRTYEIMPEDKVRI